MPALERILCPVDLSDPSRRALDYGLALARQHEATVRVVHIVDLHGWAGGSVDALTSTTTASLEEHLDWWVARGLGGASGAATDVRQGAVVPGILAAAGDMQADLIVMGSHGRSGVERLALGSVTERIVRKAPCPVIVVPGGGRAVVRTGAPSRVVCAVDFSEPSAPPLAAADLLIGDARAPLTLLTVIDWPLGADASIDPVAAVRPALERQAAESLDRLAAVTGVIPPPAIVVRHGRAGPEILQYAREMHAELIVVGVSGHGAVERAVLGSTVQHVLRDAPCPVLTVPVAAAAP